MVKHRSYETGRDKDKGVEKGIERKEEEGRKKGRMTSIHR